MVQDNSSNVACNPRTAVICMHIQTNWVKLSTGLLSTVRAMPLECMGTHLGDLGEVPQVECIVALGRCGQQLSTDSIVRLNCRGHNGSTQGSQVSWPVCQEASQDGGEDGLDGCIRGGWDAELAEMAHKAGAQRLPASPCVTHITSTAHSLTHCLLCAYQTYSLLHACIEALLLWL